MTSARTEITLDVLGSSTGRAPQDPNPNPNLPRGDLLNGPREDYFKFCVPLFHASSTGNWKAAKGILDQRRDLVRFAISEDYLTALHVAASVEETKPIQDFVQKLVDMMDSKDLELRNKNSNTAFFLAAGAGNLNIVKIMLKKNKRLPTIPGNEEVLPLYDAALYGRHKIVNYLYEDSGKLASANGWTPDRRACLLLRCVDFDIFDVALDIVREYPELASDASILKALAPKAHALKRVKPRLIWRIINSISKAMHMKVGYAENDTDALKFLNIVLENTIRRKEKEYIDRMLEGPATNLADGTQEYTSRLLFIAAEMGNTTFIVELLRAYPNLIQKVNHDQLTIFHIAVMNRHQGIYNLLYEIGMTKDNITMLQDKHGNYMLHLVGNTSKEMRRQTFGASLLMQRELLWFREVEKMMPPALREMKNKVGKTPYEVFSENNHDLVSQGLSWMKDCMVVATLIATVGFAVAYTIPGGYNGDPGDSGNQGDQGNQGIKGDPVFIHKRTFLVFVIADAISVFSSSTSLLMFLSIVTSRQGQRDFLYSLPKKLMIGLVTLFISVASMMVSFSASFFVLYRKKLKWVPILIAIFAFLPVIIFAVLQLPLLSDMFRSMYDSRYLFKPRRRILYYD
ncbi:hypothetical protein OSB04_012301 [Centaurea solstitialis]|uniref:PGG domain-containing protein n=1 Tax=Centaurea solstitialis TaxID=347529 RepID=A0AA38WEH1_9ASTR|nr:hypothetical protein OSB04_012301 [Centaurea solstitialis]